MARFLRRVSRLWPQLALNAASDRFAAIAALAGVSLWRQDGHGTIVFLANPPAGIGVLRLGQSGASGAELARHRAALAAGHGFRDIAYRCQDSDGRARHLLLSGVPRRRGAGTVRGWRGIARDITAEIATAEAMATAQARAAAAQEAASAAMAEVAGRIAAVEHARSEFLAAMSHELRTPLHAIIGFAELIRDQPFGPIAAPYAAYARDIHASGQRLLAEVNDLLDLSRIEAGQYALHEEHVLLDSLLEGCRAQLRPRLLEARLSLEDMPPPAALAGRVLVLADRQALRQTVLGLAGHAIKALLPGGRLRLGLTEAAEGGLGIALQADGAMAVAEALAGDATGLVLCRRLIGLHGGRLSIDELPAETPGHGGLLAEAVLPGHRLIHVTPAPPAPARAGADGRMRALPDGKEGAGGRGSPVIAPAPAELRAG